MVRAKFRCYSVELLPDNDKLTYIIRMYPVYSPEGENKEYWEMTPSGAVELNTVNKAAADQFREGAEYYVDFTPAN